MLKKTVLLLSLLVLVISSIEAATIDTLSIHSKVMDKEIKSVVISPNRLKESAKKLPVLYLLHGYSDNYSSWVSKVPTIKKLADQYQMIIVCPDGGFNSWYLDSPVDPAYKYESYIIKELIPKIDKKYPTKKSKKGRAITGLSMGGHGALYLSFRHQKLFGAAGSMSGGVDIRPFPKNWDIPKRLGTIEEAPENWEKHTVINQVSKLKPESLALIIDCGKDDFFFPVNQALHQKLLDKNIPHDFTIRPGRHTWNYWSNSILFQALFFHQYFDQNR